MAGSAVAVDPGRAGATGSSWHDVVYVANHDSASVTAYDVVSGTTSTISLPGEQPRSVALTPDGAEAFVTSDTGDLVPIATASGSVGTAITNVTASAGGAAVSPDGRTVYVVGSGAVTPVDVATGAKGTPIGLPGPAPGNACGYAAGGIVITPDGLTAYAVDPPAGVVVPIDLTTGTAGTPISVTSCPVHIAMGIEAAAPHQPLLYVTDNTSDEVSYVDPTTGHSLLPPHSVPTQAYGVAETWDKVIVGDLGEGSFEYMDPRTGSLAGPAPFSGEDIALAPDGATGWIVNDATSTAREVAVEPGGGSGVVFGTGTNSKGVAVTPEQLNGSGAAVSANANEPFSGSVATFTDPNTSRPASDFRAFINWGDGTPDDYGTTVAGSGGSFSVSGSHTYTSTGAYQVRVYVWFKLSRPTSISANANVAAGVPGAPTGLTASPANTQVALNWISPSSDGGSSVNGYDVYVGTSPGGEATTPVNSSLVTGTSYIVSGLTNGTQYYFTVKAINALGQSAASNEASGTPVMDDFSMTISPSSQMVTAGSSAMYSVSTTVTSGSGQTVHLGVSGLPKGVTGSFDSSTITSGGGANLTVSASTGASLVHNRTFTVTATGVEVTHTATAAVTVIPLGVANGSFASGSLKDWTVKGVAAAVTGGSDSDGYAAEVGSPTVAKARSSISETFTVPAGVSQLSISYWGNCTDSADYLDVLLKDLTTNKSGGEARLCTNSSSWTTFSRLVTPGDAEMVTLTTADDRDTGTANYSLFDAIGLS